ncbi:MAG: hypothetical protein DDT31_01780 [Syntrophomonadaceae bacterium]|nr:hypothetical protein [Bacillota bacterium]
MIEETMVAKQESAVPFRELMNYPTLEELTAVLETLVTEITPKDDAATGSPHVERRNARQCFKENFEKFNDARARLGEGNDPQKQGAELQKYTDKMVEHFKRIKLAGDRIEQTKVRLMVEMVLPEEDTE